MQGEGQRSRALRGTALGLANGVSLVFLAVLATAYGSETALPFTSIEAFLAVATAWVSGPAGTGFAWVLGYLGVFVVLASPVWSFLIRPELDATFDIGLTETSGTPNKDRAEAQPGGAAEDGQADEPKEPEESAERDRTGSDEEVTDFVWGGASGEEERELTHDQTDEETGFIWEGSSEG